MSFLFAEIRSIRQTWETSSLDSGAHQRRQPEPHRGRSRPAVQALPASDGSAVQTGNLDPQQYCFHKIRILGKRFHEITVSHLNIDCAVYCFSFIVKLLNAKKKLTSEMFFFSNFSVVCSTKISVNFKI